MARKVKLKTQLNRLIDQAKKNGSSRELREKAMAIYRKRPEYMKKEDLILFEILIKKTSTGKS